MLGRSQLVAALLVVAIGAPVLRAQEQEQEQVQEQEQEQVQEGKRFVVGVTLNSMAIDPTTAASQQVRAQSWGMQFDAGLHFKRYLFVGIDFGPQFLSDLATFTENTTGGEMKSTAALTYFSAMAGSRTRPFRLVSGIPAVALGLYGGGSVTKSLRSIDNCSDCRSDDIDIPGGAFVQPTLVFGQGRARLRVSDRYFLSGEGIRSVISAGMELGGR